MSVEFFPIELPPRTSALTQWTYNFFTSAQPELSQDTLAALAFNDYNRRCLLNLQSKNLDSSDYDELRRFYSDVLRTHAKLLEADAARDLIQ